MLIQAEQLDCGSNDPVVVVWSDEAHELWLLEVNCTASEEDYGHTWSVHKPTHYETASLPEPVTGTALSHTDWQRSVRLDWRKLTFMTDHVSELLD